MLLNMDEDYITKMLRLNKKYLIQILVQVFKKIPSPSLLLLLFILWNSLVIVLNALFVLFFTDVEPEAEKQSHHEQHDAQNFGDDNDEHHEKTHSVIVIKQTVVTH